MVKAEEVDACIMPLTEIEAAKNNADRATPDGGVPEATSAALNGGDAALATRDLTLDFVKGVLVVFMVVYHSMNVFSSAGPEAYRYVRFVSGSFILISGYIIARFYEAKLRSDWSGTSRRLAIRGLKLLLLFTLLNLLINGTGFRNQNKVHLGIERYVSSVFEIYVLGEPGYASFQILLPIAYLLIAAPIFLTFYKAGAWLLVASLTLTFGPSWFGIKSMNLDFIVLGAIGLFGGMAANKRGDSLAIRNKWGIVAGLFAAVVLMKYLSIHLSTYALGTVVILKLLYDLGAAVGPMDRIVKLSILLGQYSLVCYIAQIIFLQAAYRVLPKPQSNLEVETVLCIFATVILLIALSAVFAVLRKQYKSLARAYRFVFS